jgi:hypothetical protein
MTKQFEVLKADFIERYSNPEMSKLWFTNDLNAIIAAAISAHEAGKWKPYPENLPTNGNHIVTGENGDVTTAWFWDKYWNCNTNIIAFRELPEPYKPE